MCYSNDTASRLARACVRGSLLHVPAPMPVALKCSQAPPLTARMQPAAAKCVQIVHAALMRAPVPARLHLTNIAPLCAILSTLLHYNQLTVRDAAALLRHLCLCSPAALEAVAAADAGGPPASPISPRTELQFSSPGVL